MSKRMRLDIRDWLKGFYVATVTAAGSTLVTYLQSGWPTLPQWKMVGIAAISAGTGYIVKNLLTDNNGKLLPTKKTDNQ